MLAWAQLIVVLCVIAVTVVLVPVLLTLRRVAEHAERVLALVEQDLPPLLGEMHELTSDLRALTKDTRMELGRVGTLTTRAEDVTDGIARVLTAVAGLTRAGQLVGLAAGLKTGLDVFIHRLRKQQGEDHE